MVEKRTSENLYDVYALGTYEYRRNKERKLQIFEKGFRFHLYPGLFEETEGK